MLRSLTLAGLVLALAMVARPAAAATKVHVAYLGSVAKGLDDEARSAVDGGAVAGIQATTAIQVGVPEAAMSRIDGQPCTTPACVARAKDRSGADYFVLTDVRGTSDGTDFSVEVQLVRAQPFDVVFFEKFDCKACIPLKLRERTRHNVSLLVGRLIESLDSAAIVRVGATVPKGQEQPPVPPPRWGRTAGIALLVAAGASLATGGLLRYLDGRGVGCQTFSDGDVCARTRTSSTAGAVALGAGAALAIAGSVVLFRSRTTSTKVEVSVGALSVRGSF